MDEPQADERNAHVVDRPIDAEAEQVAGLHAPPAEGWQTGELRPISHKLFHQALAAEPGVGHCHFRYRYVAEAGAAVNLGHQLLTTHATARARSVGIGEERRAEPSLRFAFERGDSIRSVEPGHSRSEERRVGKECRSRWS